MKSLPLVSVNIRTYNSAKTLENTLKSVKNQSYKNVEIVISDGHSKDGSIDIARKYGAKIDYSDNLGDARHQNFLNSTGKYIISLDSDQIMDRELIAECVKTCEEDKFDALIISEQSLKRGNSYLEKIIAFDKWIIDKTKDSDVTFGTACPRFFRKELLQKVKWPKGLGIFDDTILYAEILKHGAKVSYISKESIRHSEVSSWIVLFRKFYRYGKSYPITFKENPSTIAAHSLPRRSYLSKAAFSKPGYFLGLLLLYFVKAFAASLGIVSYFLSSKK